VKAVYSSYFHNYIHSEAINIRKEKIKERKKEKITEKVNIIQLSDTISKRESIVIQFQEGCKVSDYVISWIPIIVVSPIFIENMIMSFDWIQSV